MGMAGMVLGIIAFALNFLILQSIIVLPVAVVGFSLSATALERAGKDKTASIRVPIAGLAINLVMLVILIYSFIIGLGWIALGP